MRPDRTFRRNFFVIATLHVAFVVGVYLFGSWHRKPAEQVIWLEGGSIGGGDTAPGDAAPAPREAAAPPPPAPKPPPIAAVPEPPPPPPPPVELPAPSEIVTPRATPEPATPKPSTPKPETPKPATPKPATSTPKPTPKATPKPKPKATPPKATPSAAGESAPTASPGEKPKGTPGASRTPGTASATKPGATGGNGPGTGNGKGPGKVGSGTGASEFGWYFSMLHDRFHARWDQPTSLAQATQDFTTTLKLRIGKDGTILSREIVRSSGDSTMDQSVMVAADRVQQIDPLPAGLTTGDVFEVNVAFKLDQSP